VIRVSKIFGIEKQHKFFVS